MFCCFWSFEFLPVGDAVTLAMSFPVWVSIIAHFVFRGNNAMNRLDWLGWIFVLTGLAGVICVAQPSFLFPVTDDDTSSLHPGQRDIGVLIGISSAICAGAQYVIVNYTKEGCHWLQIENLTSFLSVVVLMPLGFLGFSIARYTNTGKFTLGWTSLSWYRWLEEVALGLLGFCALALLTRGSMLDAPARTAICLYLQIPVTYIGQSVITFTVPNYFVFIGIFLVITSVLVPGFRKLRKQQRLAELKKRELNTNHLIIPNGDSDNEYTETSDSSLDSTNEEMPLLKKTIKKYTVGLSNKLRNETKEQYYSASSDSNEE